MIEIFQHSEIIDFYPTDFKIDLNGKKFAWQGVALLPFVDETRLFAALEPYYQKLTDAERKYNFTFVFDTFNKMNYCLEKWHSTSNDVTITNSQFSMSATRTIYELLKTLTIAGRRNVRGDDRLYVSHYHPDSNFLNILYESGNFDQTFDRTIEGVKGTLLLAQDRVPYGG
jgi:Xrn1 helical domain